MEKNKLLEILEDCIKDAWKCVREDFDSAIWWDEREIVASFYHHLRQKNEKFLADNNVQPICEYSPIPTAGLRKTRNREDLFPTPKRCKKNTEKTRNFHLDICIVKFEEDLREICNKGLSEINHRPLVAMEFKYWIGTHDIPRLVDTKNYIDGYDGFDERYLCFIEIEKNLDYVKSKLEKHKKDLKDWKIAYLLDDEKGNCRARIVSLKEFLELESSDKKTIFVGATAACSRGRSLKKSGRVAWVEEPHD